MTLSNGKAWELLSLSPLPEQAVRGILSDVADRVNITVSDTRERSTIDAALPKAELIITDWTGQFMLDADMVAAAPHLAFVQQMHSQVDNCDLEALAKEQIPAAKVKGAESLAVAEWCLTAALVLLHDVTWIDSQTRASHWLKGELAEHPPKELSGSRVGIVGLGMVGTECARLLSAFGCDVSYWSRNRRPTHLEFGAHYAELDSLLASSEILIITVKLAEETHNLLDARRLDLLPQGAIVINASRGGVMDYDALLARLDSGRIRRAALDVFPSEPLPKDDPILEHDDILFSPHVAGNTTQAQTRMLSQISTNIKRAIKGLPVLDVVNGVDPIVRRRRN